jgi:hypothetical protein
VDLAREYIEHHRPFHIQENQPRKLYLIAYTQDETCAPQHYYCDEEEMNRVVDTWRLTGYMEWYNFFEGKHMRIRAKKVMVFKLEKDYRLQEQP